MSRPRPSWLPVGLVVAAWGLGLLATWIAVTDQEKATLVVSATTSAATQTMLIPPDSVVTTTATPGTTEFPTTTQVPTTVPATTNPSPTLTISVKAENTIATLTSDLRVSLGLPPVADETGLHDYAQGWALHMATVGVLDHSDLSGLSGWAIVGENVGMGGNASAVYDALVASPEHYGIMVDVAFTAGSVGAVIDEEGRLWVCQVFAARMGTTLPTVPTVTLPSTTLPTLPTITVPTLPN